MLGYNLRTFPDQQINSRDELNPEQVQLWAKFSTAHVLSARSFQGRQTHVAHWPLEPRGGVVDPPSRGQRTPSACCPHPLTEDNVDSAWIDCNNRLVTASPLAVGAYEFRTTAPKPLGPFESE